MFVAVRRIDVLADGIGDQVNAIAELNQRLDSVIFAKRRASRLEERLGSEHQNARGTAHHRRRWRSGTRTEARSRAVDQSLGARRDPGSRPGWRRIIPALPVTGQRDYRRLLLKGQNLRPLAHRGCLAGYRPATPASQAGVAADLASHRADASQKRPLHDQGLHKTAQTTEKKKRHAIRPP